MMALSRAALSDVPTPVRAGVGRDAALALHPVALRRGELDEDVRARGYVWIDGRRRGGGRARQSRSSPSSLLCVVSDTPTGKASDQGEAERDQNDQRLDGGGGSSACS